MTASSTVIIHLVDEMCFADGSIQHKLTCRTDALINALTNN